jgi:glycosyltransferase involved in cell wall biosynthesis
MIIGHYMPGIWDSGGIAVYLRRVAAAQREAGHTVRFFDSLDRYAEFSDPELRPNIVSAEDLGTKARELCLDVLHLHSAIEPMSGDLPPMVRTLHDHHPYCPSGGRYLKRSGLPCDRVYHVGGCLWGHLVDHCGSVRPRSILANFARVRLERRSLRGMTLIAISQYVKDQMVRNGFDAGLIHTLRNPAPGPRPHQPPPREGVPHLLFLSRLSVQKGLSWLIRCLPRLERPFFLDIAGEGPQRAEMEARVIELGLGEQVKFHGWINEEAIDELASKARAVVFPAVWHEPAGLVTFDASSRGRAVIASRSGGIPEFALEGRNALIVEPQDDAGLILAIQRLIDDWELARELGETGFTLATTQFSLPLHIAELDRIYRSLQ